MEAALFLDRRKKNTGLKTEQLMFFVDKLFTTCDLGRSNELHVNELTVLEFFCAVPLFDATIDDYSSFSMKNLP